MQRKRKRGDIEIDTLVYAIAFVLAFLLALGIIIYLSGKNTSALDFLKNMFQFGR